MARDTDQKMATAKRPLFFEVFSSGLCSEELKIPDKFIRHLEGRTSGLVSLKGPSGNTWQIRLSQQSVGLFFHDGWSAFVKDHCLVCGDLLIFRYDGQLHFTVQVFDQSSCEKEAAFQAKCSQDLGNLDKNKGHKRVREESAVSSDIIEGVSMKTRKVDSFDNLGRQQLEVMEAVVKNRCGKEDELSSLGRGCGLKYSTREERKVAQSFTSTFPYFVRIMKRFNISGSYTLKVPYLFSMAHLPDSKIQVVLRNLKGECWTVNSVPTIRVHTSHTLCGGWMAFVRNNAIKMGDVCIFELVHNCEFLVHIVGIGKEGPSSENRKLASSGSTVGRDIASRKTLDALPKKLKGSSSKFHSKCTGKVEKFNKKGSKANQEATLSNDKKRHAPNEAAIPVSVASSFPNFVRIMKGFNISGSYTLKIPYQFSAAHLPQCKTEIVLRNIKGECWTVNSVPDSKGRMAHTFCGGWTAFVRDNGVKIGDICIFELVGRREMRVHISGDGRIGLDHQSGKSTCKDLVIPSSANCPF